MITVFEKIPDVFVEAYDYQFRVWAAEFRARGARCAIVFGRRAGEAALLDAGGRVVMRGCWLQAEVDRGRVVIRPASEHDAEMIARHVREFHGAVLH